MTQDAARREVRRAVEATQLSRRAFAERAKVDPKTLGDFLDGRRWAQQPTRNKIERALGWPSGRITDLAEGSQNAVRLPLPPPPLDLFAAIDGEVRLLPEVKEHLKKQVGLLLRVQALDPMALADEPAASMDQTVTDADLLADLRQARKAEERPLNGPRKSRGENIRSGASPRKSGT